MPMSRSKLTLLLVALALTLSTLALAPASAETAAPPADFIASAATLSQPDYPQIVTDTFWVPMADGEKLYVEHTRPDPATYGELQLPVILEASPYHGANATRIGDRMFPDPKDAEGNSIGLTGYFAPRGYNVVMVDLRGTGQSTGCLDHLGPKDAADLKAIVEWAADQSWSNGKVGMTGHSYVGSTPIVAAAQNPRGLATIIPSAGLASMYDHQFQKGVPYLLQYIGPMVAYETIAMQRDLPPGSPTPPVIGSGKTADNWGNGPNPQFGCGWQNTALLAGSGQVTGQYQAWHAARDWREAATAADIPVFMVQGVNDNAVRMPATDWFFDGRFDARDKVWLGQWDHGSTNGRCGDVNNQRVGHPTCRFDQMKYAIHAWFDKHLKGRDVDTGPPIEIFLNGVDAYDVSQIIDPEILDGKVYTADAWSKPTEFSTLSLDATNNTLRIGSEPEANGSKTFSTTANAVLAQVQGGKLTFASETLTEDTVFLGMPTFTLNASVNSQVQHLTATLYRVDDLGEREPMNTCAIQPALREGVETFTPVVPGEEMALPMSCFTIAHWVPAGQSLELDIATTSAHHATFGPHPRITVYTGPGKSQYALPVAPDAPLYEDVPLREAQ